jgi:tetratricopeptide (TPR) repeat protein
VAILPFLGALQADFVWDDDLMILDHAYYRDPALFWDLFTRNLVFSPNYFRPVSLLTIFADFQLHGFRPWGYHLTNVLTHAATSALAYLLLCRLLRRSPGWLPFGLALVFAWHPIHVEAVSFVAGRMDLLCAFFYVLATLIAVKAWDAEGAWQRWAWATGAGLAFLLALGAKEMAATLPLVMLACYGWCAAGSHLAPHGVLSSRSAIRKSSLRALPALLALGLGGLAYAGVRIWGMGYLYLPGTGEGLAAGSPLQHGLLVARSVARYLRLLAWPWGGLSPIHRADLPLSLADPLNWLAAGLLLGLLALGTLDLLRLTRAGGPAARAAKPAWLWLAFALSLLPVVNLLPLSLGGGAFVSERLVYLPSFFFLAALGASAQAMRFSQTPEVPRALRVSVLVALAAACLVGTLVTVPHWRDDVTLWTWALERAPDSSLPWTNLAVQAGNRGEATLALDHANRAVALDPGNPSAHDAAGLALFRLGDYAAAEQAFRHGLDLEPDDAHLWSNLAGAVREQGRVAEASHILIDEALPRDPTLWTAHLGLGLCHLAARRPDLAVEPFRAAVHYGPQNSEPWKYLIGALVATGQGRAALETMARSPLGSAEGWFHLGNDLLAGGQAVEALEAYDRALAHRRQSGGPAADAPAIHLQRGLAFLQLGDLAGAEATLQTGLGLAPRDAHLHNNLGTVLLEGGDAHGALAAFQTAWYLLPDSPLVAGNLAAAHGALGQDALAAQWQATAERLAAGE